MNEGNFLKFIGRQVVYLVDTTRRAVGTQAKGEAMAGTDLHTLQGIRLFC